MNQVTRDITNPMALAAGETGVLAQFDLIRTIEMIRSNASRIMFYSLLFGTCQSREEFAISREGIDRAIEGFELAVLILTTDEAIKDIDPEALAWVRGVVADREGDRETFLGFAERLRPLFHPELVEPQERHAFYFAFVTFAVTHFNAHFAGLMDTLSGDLTKERSTRVARATDATLSAQDAMTRIDRVSRNVRMISLNASVEAARVGSIGRGFAVIANEIRALSEEVTSATGQVRAGIQQLMRDAGR